MFKTFNRIQLIRKFLTVICVMYAVIAGLTWPVPQLPILEQSIRNLYFHVPMWFGMIALLIASAYNAFHVLSGKGLFADAKSTAYATTGMLFGVIGILTGMVWAKNTWGAYWVSDPKLNSAAIGMLMYAAYFVLRGSIEDDYQKARVAAIYNLFCLPIFLVLIFVIPRLTDSLHPGNGGNPGFNQYDLDSRLRMVFYPAVIGWVLLGFWVAEIAIRTKSLEIKKWTKST